MTDPRYDCVLADPVSGESVGLMLDADLQWQSTQPMAPRISDAKDWRSFDEWSVLEQSTFHHGRGLEVWDATDPERFYDSLNVDTRIRDQMTLAPLVSLGQVGAAGYPYPGSGTINGYTLAPDSYTDGYMPKKLAQSFEVASGVNITTINLYLSYYPGLAPTSGKNLTLRVETDSGGVPSGTLVHANATTTADTTLLGSSGQYIPFTFTSFAISATTPYWLVLTHNDTTCGVVWYGTVGDTGYSDGTCKAMFYPSSDWSDPVPKVDFFFALPDITNLAGIPTAFCQFNSKFYCAAGTAVYEWDETNDYWVAKKGDFANAVSDLASFGGVLWVAQSDGNAWTYNGSAWTEKTGITATRLLVWKGYLYRSTYSTDNRVYYTPDGSTWNTSPWKVGNPGRGERITSLAGQGYDVYVGTTHGLYTLGPESMHGDLVDQVKDFTTQAGTGNGKGMVSWANDGKLYFPVLHSLLSYQDGLLDSIGPDQDAGLPEGRQGAVSDLLSLNNWLVAAIDAGATGTSSVLVYNGSGWHEMFRSPGAGQRCQALGYDTTVTPHRLWFGYGSVTAYIEMPDNTDNPYQYSSSAYASEGHLITPWISLDMLSVDKDFQEFGVQCEMPASGSITVYYEVDRYGSWIQLFSVDADDMDQVYVGTFPFEDAFIYANPLLAPLSGHVVSAPSTALNIKVDTNADMAAGSWVRINDEVRQVASLVYVDRIVLTRALSAAPAAGDIVYPARPCGAEIRFKIELKTTNTAYTPKLQAWWLKCMPMISDKLGASLQASIYDGQTDYAGAPITPDAATRAALLHSFAKRPTPIDLTDKAGTTRRVKVTSISEVQGDWQEGAVGFARQPKRTFSLSVVET